MLVETQAGAGAEVIRQPGAAADTARDRQAPAPDCKPWSGKWTLTYISPVRHESDLATGGSPGGRFKETLFHMGGQCQMKPTNTGSAGQVQGRF